MDMTAVNETGSVAATPGQTTAAMNAAGADARAPMRETDLRKEEWTDA